MSSTAMPANDQSPDPLRILIVEDSLAERFRLSEILKREGFEITGEIGSAEEAQEQLIANSTEEPLLDLVLVDLRLPGMDGIELCRMFKRDPRYQHVPLIMVTGEESTAQLERAYDAGVVDFIKKPFNRIELLARIKSAAKSWWMEKQLRRLAHHDSLTGLVNRALLMDRLQQAIRSAQRNNRAVELIFFDLDNFKLLNDTLGHEAGDLALQQTAQRLKRLVRDADTVARLGGDEFVILLSYAQRDGGGADRLSKKIAEAFDDPFDLNGEHWQLGASIGIARYPEMATTVRELLLAADRSMYSQKCHHKKALSDSKGIGR